MLVKAKFIGKSSLGFIYNTTYTLNINESILFMDYLNPIGNRVYIKTTIGKFPNYKELRCEYQSIKVFLSLWKIVRIWIETIPVEYNLLSSYDTIIGNFRKNMRNSKIEILLNENCL